MTQTSRTVYMAVNTRVSDGFWYASDSNRCFLSKESAEAYCNELNDKELSEHKKRVKKKSLEVQQKNNALNAIRKKLSTEENDFLMFAYDVCYETNYYDEESLDLPYKFTVKEFEAMP